MERAGQQLVMVARWILTVQLLVVLVFLFFGETILGWVEAGFAAGAVVLVLLMIGDAITGSLSVSELPFLYLRPSTNIVFGGATLALNVGLGFFFVQAYGAVGAATSVLITILVVNVARIVASHRMFGQRVIGPTLAKPVAAALFASAIAWGAGQMFPLLGTAGALLQLVLAIGSYLGALALIGLEAEDRMQVRRIVDRLRPRRA